MEKGNYKVRVLYNVGSEHIVRDSDFDEVMWFKSYTGAKAYYDGFTAVSCYVELRGKRNNKWITIDWKVVEPNYMLEHPKLVVHKRLSKVVNRKE